MRMDGPWSAEQVAAHLEQAVIPLRLAVLGAAGTPLLLSLWFLPDDGALWCATSGKAKVVRHLARDPRCGFEVAADMPPYRGVRGQGRASLHPAKGADVLSRLLRRYAIDPASRLARMLTARADQETAIRIDPDRITSWDFSRRMAGATTS